MADLTQHHAKLALAFFLSLAAAPAAIAGSAAPAAPAATAAVPNTAAPNAASPNTAEADLTPEEKAERESRKACKIEMCKAFHANDPAGKDVACNVVKSWRKEQVSKLVAKLKVTWPYGPVRCTSDVKLKHADVVKALSTAKLDMKLENHTVTCKIEREKDSPTEISFDFAPTVTFVDGKATKAKMNWGKVNAPALIKSGLWTATAADNTVNILSSTLVEEINGFVGPKCDEVKDTWALKK